MTTTIGDASIKVVIDDQQARDSMSNGPSPGDGSGDGAESAEGRDQRVVPEPAGDNPNSSAESSPRDKKPRPTPQPKPVSPGGEQGVPSSEGESRPAVDPSGTKQPRPGRESTPPDFSTDEGAILGDEQGAKSASNLAPVSTAAGAATARALSSLAPLLAAGGALVGIASATERFGPSVAGFARPIFKDTPFESIVGKTGQDVELISDIVTDFRSTIEAVSETFGDVTEVFQARALVSPNGDPIDISDAQNVASQLFRVNRARGRFARERDEEINRVTFSRLGETLRRFGGR